MVYLLPPSLPLFPSLPHSLTPSLSFQLFMQCLELIRRANIMSRENYHNVFGGYMEELYTAHEQFWSWTLFPCLEHSLTSKQPLDVSIIIQRFPEVCILTNILCSVHGGVPPPPYLWGSPVFLTFPYLQQIVDVVFVDNIFSIYSVYIMGIYFLDLMNAYPRPQISLFVISYIISYYLTNNPVSINDACFLLPSLPPPLSLPPSQFSTHFEIYEQHCALDAVNLRNLNKAMKNDDFRTYLEVSPQYNNVTCTVGHSPPLLPPSSGVKPIQNARGEN